MAERIDVRDPAQHVPLAGECIVVAGAGARRDDRAENAVNLYNNNEFIFNNPFVFRDRFDDRESFFKEKEGITPDPVMGRAQRRTNIIPDVVNCDLPLDNRRSPGYRRIEPYMAGNRFYIFIGQHETGRYSKAHAHHSAAVLICLRGKGYTYTWPSARPFSDGNRDKVVRVDYEPVGMVSAAPMSGDWFHQHFGVSKEPLRLTAWHGTHNSFGDFSVAHGRPGTLETDIGSNDIREGGGSIPYDEEDPFIRQEYEAALHVRLERPRAWRTGSTSRPRATCGRRTSSWMADSAKGTSCDCGGTFDRRRAYGSASSADFYSGKQISFVVSADVGSSSISSRE